MRLTRTRFAERQIAEALRWWRRHRTSAPTLLRVEPRLAYEIIREYPDAGAPIDDADLPEIRQMILQKSRYLLFYRVLEDENRIEILALWHQSRGNQ